MANYKPIAKTILASVADSGQVIVAKLSTTSWGL